MKISTPSSRTSIRGRVALIAAAAVALVLTGCAAPAATPVKGGSFADWNAVTAAAKGQTVHLWMYGGDKQGNSYIDDVLTPAVAKQGVTLVRVPVTDTVDALNRVLTELQAGRTKDGSVDMIWVNGANFSTGKQANAWTCGWTSQLPAMAKTDTNDPLLKNDFGTPVAGCEAPWHKAQFTLVYNAATVATPPTSLAGVLDWARAHPGRFTYPAPPDFTGSVFIREVLNSVSKGAKNVPLAYDQAAFDKLTPALYKELIDLAPSLWRGGDTYPTGGDQLNQLYADGQVDMTMTYGPAALTGLVADGTYPAGTKTLTLDEGTVGNASFLGIPVNAASQAGARVVANTALTVEQQVASADPAGWGQFTVLDYTKLSAAERASFDALPTSAVVPRYEVLSKNAVPELSAAWVPKLDDGWRTNVLGAR